MPVDQLILAVTFTAMFASASWFALLWLHGRRSLRRLRGSVAATAATLDAAPGGFMAWSADGVETVSVWLGTLLPDAAGRPAVARLQALLGTDDAALLEKLVQGLRRRGEPFSATMMTVDAAQALLIDGRRARGAAFDVLWVRDVTEETASRSDTVLRQAVAEGERDGLRAMLDALPFPVWRRGEGLVLAQVNQAYADAVGSDPTAIMVEQPLLGDDRVRALPQRARDTEMPQSEVCHVVVKGERRLLELHEIPSGTLGMVGYALDHTKLEAAQSELKQHIAAHADVLENVAVAIAIYGPDERLKFHNAAYARLWDMDADWLNRQPTLDEELEYLRERRRLPEYVDFRAFKAEQQRLFTSLIDPHEDLIHLPDGKTLRKRVAPHPFGGLLFTYEDVTDSLTLERNYNTLIEVQSRSLDNLHEAVALIGADGRLKLSNPNYGRLWRLSDTDLQSEPHIAELVDKTRDLFEHDDWTDLRARIIGRVTQREPRSGRFRRADGSVLEYGIVPLPDGMVLLTYIDVTDRFRIEQALHERNDALVAADQLKTEFIANVSYELRTPLNTIIGFAEILDEQMFGELNERQAEYCSGILSSSAQLLDLINDILDLASIEAGYMELELGSFAVKPMMESIYGLTRERARQHRLNLSLECADTVGDMIADERRLKQVMFNLVSNAIKFTPTGGSITLAAERSGDELVFSVCDTGVGIPEEEHARVLEIFERGSYPTVRQSGSGAGLGLSLVRSFVELHGGTVELISQPDLGTTIICHVPAEVEQAVAPAAAGAA